MKWYTLNPDHTTALLPDGEYPMHKEITGTIKHVGDETIDGQRVSTVFLHLDHNWDPEGQPVLFETMIFGGPYDQEMWRYHTWDEAKASHDNIVHRLKEGLNPHEAL